MGAIIPAHLQETPFSKTLQAAGLRLVHRGKVRDSYEIPDNGELLLQVATDRISVYDVVLPAQIPNKGAVLTGITAHWLKGPLNGYDNHLFAYGPKMDPWLPEELQGNNELMSRAIIVMKVDVLPYELIVRGYLTGSAWKSYQKDGTAFGITLPPGLHDGSRLPVALFTPTTKAQEGHDLPVAESELEAKYRRLALEVYAIMAHYCKEAGLILADTKLEVGKSGRLCDEIGTPDSSRFWDIEAYNQAQSRGELPLPMDKQIMRNWFQQTVKRKIDPASPVDQAFVANLVVPDDIIAATSEIYLELFQRLIGTKLQVFHETYLGIPSAVS